MHKRSLQTEPSRTPSLPKSEPPINDPPYEVIEFPTRQYSNTSSIIQNRLEQKKQELKRKCDLCGSTSAQFHCELCAQQAFCVSCDQMYHRHPKRQAHIRKRLPNAVCDKNNGQPPVPPKGELSLAPIPPPRRNKRGNKTESLKKNGSIMGSLKRFVGIPPFTSQFQSKTTGNDSRPPKFAHNLHSVEFDKPTDRRDIGYLDWESENRNRAGSFATLSMTPGFAPMIQAQSMAQLNCPSCHHGMSAWDWNRSQMNLNFPQPWPGMSTNTWHGSVMFPPPYRMPENFSDHFSRRGSVRHQRYNRRPSKFNNDDDSESELSFSDDRRSKRRSPPTSMRGVSPALSRKSRKTIASDSEDEAMSRKSGTGRPKRKVSLSRDPSPAVFRRTFRKKFDDDDVVSIKSASSRKCRKSPINSKQSFLRKKNVSRSSSDSDDELTSEREVNCEQNTGSNSADEVTQEQFKTSRKTENVQTPRKTQVSEKIKNYEQLRLQAQEKNSVNFKNAAISTSIVKSDGEDWECEHCTYLNVGSSRVCDVCCKSRNSEKPVNEESLVESMKTLNVSAADAGGKKKGEQNDQLNSNKANSGTSPLPQSASTQTYDTLSMVTKRNRSLSFDDYSDWNPMKKSSGAASLSSENQSSSINQENSPQPQEYVSKSQKQMKDGLEIVKLLKEAEKYQFNPDDLTVALMHCGEANPVKWLLENWNKMIDTVLTLATNYGHEQPENIIGTISSFEAKAALHLHNGDIWAAATECIRQRQRKFAKLMSKGNFTREDVVTVLTANHGDVEKAYMELRKSQLKPFLMKIWGPPQGLDNDSSNPKDINPHYLSETSKNNFNFIHTWLKSVNSHYNEEADLADFMKLKNNLKQYAGNVRSDKSDLLNSEMYLSSDYASSEESDANARMKPNTYLRYRSCENLNNNGSMFARRFYKSSESLFRNRSKVDSKRSTMSGSSFFLHDPEFVESDFRNSKKINRDFISQLQLDKCNVNETDLLEDHSQYENVIEKWSNSDNFEEKKVLRDSSGEEDITDDSLGSVHSFDNFLSVNKEISDDESNYDRTLDESDYRFTHITEPEKENDLEPAERKPDQSSQTFILDQVEENQPILDQILVQKQVYNSNHKPDNIFDQIQSNRSHRNNDKRLTPEEEKPVTKDDENENLFQELKSLFFLAKYNLEFLVISNNDLASLSINDESDLSKENSLIKSNTRTDADQIQLKSLNARVQKDVQHFEHSIPSFSSNLFVSNAEIMINKKIKDDDNSNHESNEVLNDSQSTKTDDSAMNIDNNEASSDQECVSDNYESDDLASSEKSQNNRTKLKNEEINPTHRSFDDEQQLTKSSSIRNIEMESIKSVNFNSCIKDNAMNFAKNQAGILELDLSEREQNEDLESSLPSSKIIDVNHSVSSPPDKVPTDKERNEISASFSKTNDSFSEYIREIVVTTDELVKNDDDMELLVSNDEKHTMLNFATLESPEEYLSDSSEDSFKTQVQNCLSEGISTYDQAVVAAQLIKLKFDRSQSLDAAKECSNIQAAITFLQQECELCADKVSIKEMFSMLECEHSCCRNCAEQFFSLQISEKSILDCVCPFCKEPRISALNSDKITDYFSNLDILLKTILHPNTHELFQRKLRDRTLMQDPNFKWCSKCSSGFIADPEQRWVLCPDCKSMSCTQCGKLWSKEHDGKTCEQYKLWAEQNDSDTQLSRCLEDYGISCPKCDTKFILVKGGCMHLTCTDCKYEFCSDCLKPFRMGTMCEVSDYCAKLGLHAHHPRNCLFYLRDKEPQELKQLLKDNNVPINLSLAKNTRCNVQLQKETDDGLVDTVCGARVLESGLCRNHLREYFSRIICRLKLETIDLLTCDDLETIVTREDVLRRTHFVEYLTALIRKNKIDPVVIFDLAEVLQEFRRQGKSLPIRAANIFEHQYRRQCIEIIKEEMPII